MMTSSLLNGDKLMADEELHTIDPNEPQDSQSDRDSATPEMPETNDIGELNESNDTAGAEKADEANGDVTSEGGEAVAAEATVDDASAENDDENDDARKTSSIVDMDKVEAVLNATADTTAMTPQMRRMMSRQEESTKRVEESIKGTKSNPRWFVPLFCTLMVVGLIWVVAYYLTSTYPIPNIGAWNLLIGFVIIMIGFLMTMWWR